MMLDPLLSDLYEDEASQIAASRRLLELSLNPEFLVELGNHETALTVLSRILLEESKQLSDLPASIVAVFFLFSNSAPLQEILRRHKAGDAVFRQFEFEITRRAPVLQEALVRKMQEFHASRKESLIPDLNNEQAKIERQNRLLYICLSTLSNLAIDRLVEKKMVNRGILPLLAASLARDFLPLRTAALEWLLRLSVVEAYKDEMQKINLCGNLVEISASPGSQLLVYRLLANLAFCPEIRKQLADSRNFHRATVEALRVPELRAVVVKFLTLISEHEEISESLALIEDTPHLLLSLAVGLPEKFPITRELAVLIGNLAYSGTGATSLAASPLVVDFFVRACELRDSLALRVLKILTSNGSAASTLLTLLKKTPGWQDALVAAGTSDTVHVDEGELPVHALEEVLGIFGNFGEAGLKKLDSYASVEKLTLRGLRSEIPEIKLEAVMTAGSLLSEISPEMAEALVRVLVISECSDTLNQCMHTLLKVDRKFVDKALNAAADKVFNLLRSNSEELRSRAEILCERVGDDERLKAARFASWNGELIFGNFELETGEDDLRRNWSARTFTFD